MNTVATYSHQPCQRPVAIKRFLFAAMVGARVMSQAAGSTNWKPAIESAVNEAAAN